MNILLLGELSGVHEELAPALRRAGCAVTVGHAKSASPEFASEIPFFRADEHPPGRINQVRQLASQLWHASRLTGFDVVQVVTPKFFNWTIHAPMMRYLKRNNGALVIVDTSCSFDTFRRWRLMRYRPCGECLALDLRSERCIYDDPHEQAAEETSHDFADAIVVTAYEYRLALQDTGHAAKLVNIPLPIDTQRHLAVPMPQVDRVQIYYGETRHGFKGGRHIMAALDALRGGALRDRIDIFTSARLPFNDYLAAIDRCHIVIDQANSHSMGMNALYPLAKGRVVLSGAEPESLAFHGVSTADNAIINIRPDADDIAATLTALIESPDALPTFGAKSREYVEKVHASDIVARRYVQLYRERLEGRHSRP